MRTCVVSAASAAVLIAAGSGCASGLRKDVRALSADMRVLKRTLKRTRATVEELSNQVFILQDRVDSNRTALKRRHGSVRLPEEKEPRPSPAAKSAAGKAADKPAVAARLPARAATRKGTRRRTGVAAVRDPAKGPGPDVRPRLRVVKLRPKRRGAKGKARARRRPMLRLYERRPVRVRGGSLPPISVGARLPVVPIPSIKGPIPASGPIQEYKAAYALYLKGKTKAAAAKFSAFARHYPKHDYADNALFWLGQCLYRQGLYRKALWVFRKVVKRYPSGNKAPDSLLKIGLTYVKLGRKGRARRILDQVVKLYPRTRVSRVAAKVLKGLGSG
jgi:tol-pal system protein YbgF